MKELWKMTAETAVDNVNAYMLHMESYMNGHNVIKPTKAERERAMYGIATLRCIANYAKFGNLDKYQERESEYQELERKRGANKNR